MKDYTVHTEELQALSDKKKSGKERPWQKKKEAAMYLSMAYREVDERKTDRLVNCAGRLEFRRQEDGAMTLHSGYFCKVRLCPVCAWRRSLKIHSNMTKVMAEMANNGYAYVFATFTVKNVSGHELPRTLDDMFAGWQRLTQTQAFRGAVKGWYRGLEVTHNVKRLSASYDTYHPHFHAVFAVESSYFKRGYISKMRWVEMWRKAMRLDYDPNVYIQRVKGNTAKAVAEAAKYSVKDADYIIPEDWNLTVDSVRTLDTALTNRRLVGYGGAMREVHRRLNLGDEVDGDLVHIDGDEPTKEGEAVEMYAWYVGYRQYYRTD